MWETHLINTEHGPRVGMFHAGELTALYPASRYQLNKCTSAAHWLNQVSGQGVQREHRAA